MIQRRTKSKDDTNRDDNNNVDTSLSPGVYSKYLRKVVSCVPFLAGFFSGKHKV